VRVAVSVTIAVAFVLNAFWTPYHLATEHDHDLISLSATAIDDDDHHHHDDHSPADLVDGHESHSSSDHDMNMTMRKYARMALDVAAPRIAQIAFYEAAVSERTVQPNIRPPSFEPQTVLRLRGPPAA
jgi:hypothetical protein